LTIGGGGPTITQQPRSVSSCVGRPASISVTAQGAGLSYQWRLNNNPIPGATNATYAIASVASGDFGTYTVLVSLGSCSTLSNPATLTNTVRGDANCSGQVNNFDIDAFVLALAAPQAWQMTYPCDLICANDINGNGLVNNFDIELFVECVANLGCP
ncbi:MAG: hypothetical protein AB7Q17_04055, partial [Phycisphaerae bacterium]